MVITCPPLTVTAAAASFRLSGEKAIRRGVPSLEVMLQLSCCSIEGLYTSSFAMLVWSSVTTASVPLSDMAQRKMLFSSCLV